MITDRIGLHSVLLPLWYYHYVYCNTLLHDVSRYQQPWRLQRALNAAARLICRLPKYYHISSVDLHWLPIKYRVIFKITLLVFKVLDGLALSYLENLIRVKPEGLNRLRNKDQLLFPKTICKTFGDWAFFKSAPVRWNSLPDNIGQITNIQKFKKKT